MSPRPAVVACLLALAGAPAALGQAPARVAFSPFDDPESVALGVLDQATETLDLAQYNIRNERFREKLLELRDRGVRIRIVVDAKAARQEWNTLDDALEEDGFALKRVENTNSDWAIVHHKFSLVDGRTVMTGSYNWNETAQVFNDENMVVLEDPAVAAAYRAEFAELWGEAEERPTPLVLRDPEVRERYARVYESRWGEPPPAAAGEPARVETYFSPEDMVRYRLLDLIRTAERRIHVAMFTFTDRQVARALRDAAARGVEVVLVVEEKQAERTGADETVAEAETARVIVGGNTSSTHTAMHHKFAVFDDEVVVTGACNWTYNAFHHSNEDLLVIRDAGLARRYTDEFAALVRRYDPDAYRPEDFRVGRAEASVHFVVRCPATAEGDAVYVIGEHENLGAWDPARAVRLRTSDSLWPMWGGNVRLPAGLDVRWKLVIRGRDGAVREWELSGRGDRTLHIDPAGTDLVVRVDYDVGEHEEPPAESPGLAGSLPGSE